jgi:pimeloyl-ACP methyl ester carboxylesterase
MAQAELQPGERVVPVGEGLALWCSISGTGPEVIVAPSASWLGADLQPLARGRTLVGYDLRGRGRSSAVLADALLGLERDLGDLEVLRAALGLERMTLLGWSYHGALVARYALSHPEHVSKLVLVAPSAPRLQPYFGEFLDRFARRVDPKALFGLEELRRRGARQRDPVAFSRAVHDIYLRAYVVDPACLSSMQSSPAVEPNLDAERVNDRGRRTIEQLGPYDWRADFRDVCIPALILHGTLDPLPIEGSREWERSLPAARLVALADVGHMPWLECPDRFFAEVEGFLAEA